MTSKARMRGERRSRGDKHRGTRVAIGVHEMGLPGKAQGCSERSFSGDQSLDRPDCLSAIDNAPYTSPSFGS
jgi:hypothetical protein